MDCEQPQQPQQQAPPLTNRSTNTHLSTASTSTSAGGGDEKTAMSLKQNGNGLLRPGQVNQNQSNYVSPSDGIMSPCTKKLSDLKGKRFKSAGKPQSLFAKTIQKKSQGTNAGEMKESSSSSLKVEERSEE